MRTFVIAAALATALTLAGCGSDGAPEDLCTSPTDTTTVEMAEFSYTPACVAATTGDSLDVRNVGDAPHTYTVEETDIDVQVEAEASAAVDLAGVAAGTYRVVCTLHPQMEGALQVN